MKILEQAADISANEVYPPMIEVYPRIPNSTCVEFEQKVIDHNAHNRMLHIEGFKAGAKWQKKQDELTWQDIAEIWHIVEDLYDSGDYTGDAAYLFYNEALEKFKKIQRTEKQIDMENYEKKYKDALEYMRKVYLSLSGCDKEDAEHYFPELKKVR